MTPIPSFIPLTPLPASPEGYRGLATDRVLRHFAVTCAERVPVEDHVVKSRNEVLKACRMHADGEISLRQLVFISDGSDQGCVATYWAAAAQTTHAADRASAWAVYRLTNTGPRSNWREYDNQCRLFTLHIGKAFLEYWSDRSIAVSRWSPDWRTEATADLAKQIAEGNLGLAGVLADELQDEECDNHVWLRILRECPEIIRPGMWFWDRLRGIVDAKTTKVEVARIETADGIANVPNRIIMG